MAFLQIRSANPSISYVLGKNPASGLIARPLKKGTLFGWYDVKGFYNIYFKDSFTEVSFKEDQEEDFEYLDVTRFNSPMFPLSAFNTLLHDVLQKDIPEDIPASNVVVITQLEVTSRRFEHFRSFFPEYLLAEQQVAPNNYKVLFSVEKGTLRQLLSYVSIFCLYNVLKSNINIFIDEGMIKRYMKFLEVVDAPYFIRYLYKTSLLKNKEMFAAHKEALEKTSRYKISLTQGYNADVRIAYAKQHLIPDTDILDVGCGEGAYLFLAGKLPEGKKYYGIDKDPEALTKITLKSTRKAFTNTSFLADFSGIDGEKKTALLMEVIEHCEKEEAAALIKFILALPCVDKLILSTPNKDFNVYYNFADDEARHDDHKWEMTSGEFIAFLYGVVPKGYDIDFSPIGDTVNDTCCTLGAVIRRPTCL